MNDDDSLKGLDESEDENNQNGKVVNLVDSFMEFAKMRAPPEIANHSDIAEIPVRF